MTAVSLIRTNQWRAYNCLSANGFEQDYANDLEHYLDPVTDLHTQGVERAQIDTESWYKASRGNGKPLQGHLHEASWRKLQVAERDVV